MESSFTFKKSSPFDWAFSSRQDRQEIVEEEGDTQPAGKIGFKNTGNHGVACHSQVTPKFENVSTMRSLVWIHLFGLKKMN